MRLDKTKSLELGSRFSSVSTYRLDLTVLRNSPSSASASWGCNKSKTKRSQKVANQRQNFVNQETTQIISCNSTVVTEKLEVKNMTAKAKKGKRRKQKAGLNKSILDVGMGMIKSALNAKLSDIGGVFVEVPTRKVRPFWGMEFKMICFVGSLLYGTKEKNKGIPENFFCPSALLPSAFYRAQKVDNAIASK